ncbi:MAG: hypothetical protein DCC69_05420 [Hyphomicrobiales bacterium]|nr:MAG: hypothetical protein DCC69_05420 [Hyphomicrobiales bacterium]
MDGPLARYHAVLIAVAEAPGGMQSAELARATGLPRSTAHRLATSLDEIGYLHCQRRSKSRPLGGAKVVHLAAHLGNAGRA